VTAAEIIACLTEARLGRGLSLRDVADRSPVLSHATLYRHEQGLVSPSLAQLEAWAAALDCRLEMDLLLQRRDVAPAVNSNACLEAGQ